LLKPDIIICIRKKILKKLLKDWVRFARFGWQYHYHRRYFQIISDFGQLLTVEPKRRNDKLAYALNDFKNFIKDKP
jgi:hypothetical protein